MVAFAREQPYLPEALVNEIQPLLEPPGEDDPWPRRRARVTNDHAAAAGGNSPFVRDRRAKGRCARNCCRAVWPLCGRYRCGRDGGRARSFSQATRGWADIAGNLARRHRCQPADHRPLLLRRRTGHDDGVCCVHTRTPHRSGRGRRGPRPHRRVGSDRPRHEGVGVRTEGRHQVHDPGSPPRNTQHDATTQEPRAPASGLRQRAGGTDPPSSARHELIACVGRNRSQSPCWHTSVDTTWS
jgi:hypothetical protein